MRAYDFYFRGRNGNCSVTIDLTDRPVGYTLPQATMEAITAVIDVKGPGWIIDFETQEVQ